jgi:hypothetical protein
MGKFTIVLLAACLFVGGLALLWPRFFDTPRPEPLGQINLIIRGTPQGQHMANVLGVSDEASVVKLSPAALVERGVTDTRNRVTDVLITHASRIIIERFSTLPDDQQQRILEALSSALSTNQPSPAEQLPEATQSSTNTNNDAGTNE